MKLVNARGRRRTTAQLLASGVGTITLDQTMRKPKAHPTDSALAGDWIRVGHDLRWAMKQVGDEIEAA